MIKRRYSALAVLALAAAAVMLPASSASAASATTSNACANSVTANFSQIGVTTSGDDGLTTVAPGGTTTTTGLSQQAAIPGAIFVAGYNLGLLVQGTNNVPANVRSTIEATNTVQGQQLTNVVGGTPPNGTVAVTTTITDPDGTPGTGDETATDASFSVTYNNLTWTAGASGTIDYRQQSIATAPPTAANNALLINALVGGVFNVQFRCAPGTVTPPDPGIITLIDPAGSFDTTTIQAAPVNTAPTADAGPDQTIQEPPIGQTVTLDGSGSTDPDAGDTLNYAWSQTSGPAVALSDPTAVMPTFTAPAGPATLTFDLTVCDRPAADPDQLCDTDSVTVTVQPEVAGNTAPTADAGPDQTIQEPPIGQTVTLDGSGSTDPDAGDTLNYAWSQTSGPAVALSDPTAVMPTFTAPAGPATLTFDLTVCDRPAADPDQLCDTDSVTVTVQPEVAGNTAPTADAGPDQTIQEPPIGQTVTLDGSGSTDPDAGDTLNYAWSQTSGPAVALSDPTAVMPTFTAPAGPATLTFDLTVCDRPAADPDQLCDTDSVTVTVQPEVAGNTAPTADAGPDQTIQEPPIGQTVTLDGSGSTDPDAGDTLNYAWSQTSGPAVALSDPTAVMPTFTAPAGPATLTFDLTVCDRPAADPDQLCDTDSVTVTVQPEVAGNTAPTADAGPDQTIQEPPIGQTVTLDGSGSTDPDAGDTLNYAWSQTSGPAVALSDPTAVMPTFTAPAGPATLTFDLTVCDRPAADPDQLCDTDSVTVTVQPEVAEEIDAAGDVIVNGKVHKKTDHKVYFLLVTNLGDSPITVDPTTDIDASVLVNGIENGSVEALTGPKTIAPGDTRRFPLRWTGDDPLAKGDTVEFTACVNLAGDVNPANNCDSETRTAVGKGHCDKDRGKSHHH